MLFLCWLLFSTSEYCAFCVPRTDILTELGKRQHWRNNVTMLSGQHFFLLIALWLNLLWLLHLDTQAFKFFRIFYCHWNSNMFWRCRCREAKKIVACSALHFEGAPVVPEETVVKILLKVLPKSIFHIMKPNFREIKHILGQN